MSENVIAKLFYFKDFRIGEMQTHARNDAKETTDNYLSKVRRVPSI